MPSTMETSCRAPSSRLRLFSGGTARVRASMPDLEHRCHHRDVVDTGTKPGADTCLDRADLTQFLYSVPMRNRLDLFMCS